MNEEQQLLDQIQHYPYVEYTDSNRHIHRCFTVRTDADLYYIGINPFDHGERRIPSAVHMSASPISYVPPITRSQLEKITHEFDINDILKLFCDDTYGAAGVRTLREHRQLFLYTVFISNMRERLDPEGAGVAYNYDRGPDCVNGVVFCIQLKFVNYAFLASMNPMYALIDHKYVSQPRDSAHLVHSLGWACRYVPLGKRAVFGARIPYYDGREYDCRHAYVGDETSFHEGSDKLIEWCIEHGMLFHTHYCGAYSLCTKCEKFKKCIRTRAGEPYTCLEISRSYYWQYQILTVFGSAEHKRYVKLCKKVYG